MRSEVIVALWPFPGRTHNVTGHRCTSGAEPYLQVLLFGDLERLEAEFVTSFVRFGWKVVRWTIFILFSECLYKLKENSLTMKKNGSLSTLHWGEKSSSAHNPLTYRKNHHSSGLSGEEPADVHFSPFSALFVIGEIPPVENNRPMSRRRRRRYTGQRNSNVPAKYYFPGGLRNWWFFERVRGWWGTCGDGGLVCCENGHDFNETEKWCYTSLIWIFNA